MTSGPRDSVSSNPEKDCSKEVVEGRGGVVVRGGGARLYISFTTKCR